ncbi:hypothetical protein Pmar_PMAR025357 [Perkinsus marinus ATCC 50983]|uniref:Uncharacterized protein n=1 Tax=Perkinsus marinus (strain ATCC 50983 / TXsc) TaxID=423536 RepID=C5KS33_PERM5|nr:hypothetical protein Pmar_PMAR025357 [Perkinsus marinus ATCC 50983]EER12724.1 hypothetical protein Pmar_PMAR025357 [Perkinsus marinus ATCC 50983]|eukprot:XP_002780929.1 hypothetical protein Pmar_PMAR025357 [Perkinsus marinus ATCC 50983]
MSALFSKVWSTSRIGTSEHTLYGNIQASQIMMVVLSVLGMSTVFEMDYALKPGWSPFSDLFHPDTYREAE